MKRCIVKIWWTGLNTLDRMFELANIVRSSRNWQKRSNLRINQSRMKYLLSISACFWNPIKKKISGEMILLNYSKYLQFVNRKKYAKHMNEWKIQVFIMHIPFYIFNAITETAACTSAVKRNVRKTPCGTISNTIRNSIWKLKTPFCYYH